MTRDGCYLFGVCTASMAAQRYTSFLETLRAEAPHYNVRLLQFGCFSELAEQSPNDLGEKAIFRILPYDRFDALVLLTESFKDPSIPKEIAEKAQAAGIPVFSIDNHLDGCINFRYGYADAFGSLVEHLITVHGCKTINLIAGIRGNAFEIERTNQYREVLTRHNIPIEDERIGYGSFWAGPTYEVIDRFMRSNLPFPDAIACENDAMAVAACDRLIEYGYSVPEDVLVVGLDGIEEAASRTPSITTAHKDTVGSVKRLFQLFSDLRHGKEIENDCVIPFRVTFEQSCGCVPVVANDASRIMTRFLNDKARLDEFDRSMEHMRHEIIRLSYRDMLQKLAPHLLENSWICLRADYNTSLDIASFGTYSEPEEAYTQMMNSVLWRSGDIYLYNRFYPLSQLLPDIAEAISQNSGITFIPLHFQEVTFGYMALSMDTTLYNYEVMQRFSSNLCTILQVIEQQERVILLNRQLEGSNRKMQELYSMDPLTGLYNRRGFYDYMEAQAAEHGNPDEHLILFSIDMDGLKRINDTYGHKEGDFSLCLLADSMKHLCRRYENLTAARFGGDEFIIAGFFPADSHIEKDIETTFKNQLSFLNVGSGKGYEVSASIGCVEVSLISDGSLESAINEADTLMYEQKAARKKARLETGNADKDDRL